MAMQLESELTMNDPAIIDEMLRSAQTIAVVGMSDKSWRASHNIGRYLVEKGYTSFPSIPRSLKSSASSAIPISTQPRPPRKRKHGKRNRPGRRIPRLGERAAHRR